MMRRRVRKIRSRRTPCKQGAFVTVDADHHCLASANKADLHWLRKKEEEEKKKKMKKKIMIFFRK